MLGWVVHDLTQDILMFSQIDLLFSSTPLEGPEQMGLDEVLLRHASRPVLRLYSWKGPCVTFGYFQHWEKIHAAFPERLLVRRSSGGGLVEHDGDMTFSLVVPALEPMGKIAPSWFYKQLHETLARVLQEFGFRARLVAPHESHRGESCFHAPSASDLVIGDQKILGGAQRRCAGNLLYQGSLHLLGIPKQADRADGGLQHLSREDQVKIAKSLFSSLASHLSKQVNVIDEQPSWLEGASALALERYATISWTQRK